MKNKVTVLIIVLLIGLVFSCNSEKKNKSIIDTEVPVKKNSNPQVKTKEDDNFNVKIEFVSSEDGLLQLWYNLEEDPSVWEKKYFGMKKASANQTFEANYNLDEIGSPKIVRFILGGESPKKIDLKKFVISADDNILEINPSNFKKFISYNEFIKYNEFENTLSTIKVENRHLPIMALTKRALDSLSY